MMKTCLCAIAKMENHYIREWVEHYRSIGISKIIICDNNNVDGEHFDEVIGDYIESGYVLIVDVRGQHLAQGSSYLRCYKEFGSDFDWIAFFDIDEFLILDPKYKNIDEFLGESMFSSADLIRVSWRMMSDSGHVRVENGDYSLVKRFTEPVKNGRMWTKAIVRGKINDFDFNVDDGEASPHLIRCKGINFAVNTAGDRVSNASIRERMTHKNAWLNHYSMKTIEEFVLNKKAKGWAVPIDEQILNKDMFFEQNEWTKEKEDLYNELTK